MPGAEQVAGPEWPSMVIAPGSGGVAIGSARYVSIVQGLPQSPARSAYAEQVRRIAPPDPPGLVGREAEFAELARFCLDPARVPYLWWRADAWSGKSALLSTFVLRPPAAVAARVRIVSFFITARLASQDTREAFTQVLGEQLAELVGQPLPTALPAATREAHLLDLLARAAAECAQADGRLVLVVDGLDEDRDAGASPDAHSIAALLPAQPPSGMRVVVAGRPDPPVPDDVPDQHPLRDPGIRRDLAVSPHAVALRRMADRELKRLLAGDDAERRVAGLLTAARGGLSVADLEALGGVPVWRIEEILSGVTGRTFAQRGSALVTGTGPDVYILGHGELLAAAVHALGGQLAGYHGELHAWADGYRAQGWPAATPEYLMLDYFRLLTELEDLPRVIACAADAQRHDRMLQLTGGDEAALVETRSALDRIAAQEQPDLTSALRIACHRDQLAERNDRLPVELPAVWAALGEETRAFALTGSLDANARASALVRLVSRFVQDGKGDAAARAASLAAATAISAVLEDRAAFLGDVGAALAADGQVDQAAAVAQAIVAQGGPDEQSDAESYSLARIAAAVAGHGPAEIADTLARRAVEVAQATANPSWRASRLLAISGCLTSAGLYPRAVAAARQALAAAGAVAEPDTYTWDRELTALATQALAAALAGGGRLHEAAATVSELRTADERDEALAAVATVLAATGEHEQAVAAARAIRAGTRPAKDVAAVAVALAAAGHAPEADALASRARELAGTGLTELIRVATLLSAGGLHDQAIAAAEDAAAAVLDSPGWQAVARSEVATVRTAAGQHAEAVVAAAEARGPGLSELHVSRQADVLAKVAAAFAAAGRDQDAVAAADAISFEPRRTLVISEVVSVLAEHGWPAPAIAVTRSMTSADPAKRGHVAEIRADTAARLAVRLAAAGQLPAAEEAAALVADPSAKAAVLAQMAEGLASAGHHVQAALIAARAEERARSVTSAQRLLTALTDVTRLLADADAPAQAEEVARLVTDQRVRDLLLQGVAQSFVRTGQLGRAREIAGSIGAGRAVDGAPEAADEDATIRSAFEAVISVDNVLSAAAGRAKAEVPEDAESIAAVGDPLKRTYLLMRLATAAAAAGQPERAADAASQAAASAAEVAADAGTERAIHAQMLAVRALTAAGARAAAETLATRAVTAAKSVDNPGDRDGQLVHIIRGLADAGWLDFAEQLAAAVAAPGPQDGAFRVIARRYGKDGRPAGADAAIRAMSSPSLQNTARGEVAEELAKAGHGEQAVAAARAVTGQEKQAQVIASIARIQWRLGARDSARRLAAQACAAGRWETAASAVLLAEPSASAALVPMLLGRPQAISDRHARRG